MPANFLEAVTRNFDSMSIPGLGKEAQEAANAALKAVSAWRNELVEANEKNGKRVLDKMAAAVSALGWPEQVVDAARTQMQSIAEMQIKTMDQVMDAWQEQLKSPNPMASPSAMLSKLKSLPGFAGSGHWPSTEEMQKAAANPLQFWLQFATQWQKSWEQAMKQWGAGMKGH
jgi:hypothetical protein